MGGMDPHAIRGRPHGTRHGSTGLCSHLLIRVGRVVILDGHSTDNRHREDVSEEADDERGVEKLDDEVEVEDRRRREAGQARRHRANQARRPKVVVGVVANVMPVRDPRASLARAGSALAAAIGLVGEEDGADDDGDGEQQQLLGQREGGAEALVDTLGPGQHEDPSDAKQQCRAVGFVDVLPRVLEHRRERAAGNGDAEHVLHLRRRDQDCGGCREAREHRLREEGDDDDVELA